MFSRTSLFLCISVVVSTHSARAEDVAERYAESIAKFEKQDKQANFQPGGVLFVGSSSIRKWDLAKSFPDKMPINRGFGGSQIADSIELASRIIIPRRPTQIVMYAGDNDINHGKDAATVIADFEHFVNTVFESLPDTKIAFIAIKPSRKRWDLWSQMKQANDGIAKICDTDSRLKFIDIAADMLVGEAMPTADLFLDDGLHLSEKGYQLWSNRIRSTLGW